MNTIENNNSFLGADSDLIEGITNATAIGYKAQVSQSNRIGLYRILVVLVGIIIEAAIAIHIAL